ncbi:MAG: sugar ABC transporter permease [Ornithinimicrobium sp.]
MSTTATDVIAETIVERPPVNRPTIKNKSAIAIFLGPFLFMFVFFYVGPIVFALVQSFLKVERDGAFGAPTQVFGGLTQYAAVAQSSEFWTSIRHVVIFFFVSVPIQLLFSLVLALLLDSPLVKGKKFFRLAYFAPYAVPSVVAAIIWGYLYLPQVSPFQALASSPDFAPLSPNMIYIAMANIVFWTFVGYNMVIIYSSMQSISPDMFEAAKMDGAGQLRIAWSIKIPLVAPALIMATMFSIIGTLQLFNEPTVLATLTSAVDTNWSPNMIVLATTNVPNYNLAAAFSVALALVSGVLSFVFLRLTQKRAFS